MSKRWLKKHDIEWRQQEYDLSNELCILWIVLNKNVDLKTLLLRLLYKDNN